MMQMRSVLARQAHGGPQKKIRRIQTAIPVYAPKLWWVQKNGGIQAPASSFRYSSCYGLSMCRPMAVGRDHRVDRLQFDTQAIGDYQPHQADVLLWLPR